MRNRFGGRKAGGGGGDLAEGAVDGKKKKKATSFLLLSNPIKAFLCEITRKCLRNLRNLFGRRLSVNFTRSGRQGRFPTGSSALDWKLSKVVRRNSVASRASLPRTARGQIKECGCACEGTRYVTGSVASGCHLSE